ncbi:tektin family domain-containing protein [Phthorimaea operculella]|nr:tektin family domain-containing protein [Phthorimaea operculella]
MENPYDKYIGSCPMYQLQVVGDDLSNRVLDKVNDTLELVMVNDFARETNENHFKRSLEERMADIASWRWVFEDLCRRLEESKTSLKYELKAGRVVEKRVKQEIEEHSKMATKPGALKPKCDCVEHVILEEYRYLKEQREVFDELCQIIEKQIANLEKLIKKIQNDILQKEETIAIEATMAEYNLKNIDKVEVKTKRKKKPFSLEAWENKCLELKREGLNALHDALLTKQQVRGARVQLTIAAQSLASKVDNAIRKRLHVNHIKLDDLKWQKQEAEKDLQALQTEQLNTEQTVVANMEQERVILARLADRSYRPDGEMTRDEVEYNLKAELGRVRRFISDLRKNLNEITHLQEVLKETIIKIDCYSDDLSQIIQLDEDRMKARLEGPEAYTSSTKVTTTNDNNNPVDKQNKPAENPSDAHNLHTIKEEEEEVDDYPFKD